MPIKNLNPLLPYLDPEFVPEHPTNRIPDFSVEEEGYWSGPRERTPRERQKMEREWLKKEMQDWNPPHVVRSWEVNEDIAYRRRGILSLELEPRVIHPFEKLTQVNKYDSSITKGIGQDLYNHRNEDDERKTNFRRYAQKTLHLAYHRFHATHGEPNLPSEEETPDVPPEEICWIMEYSENECHITRRKLAREMGLYPAVVDERTTEYDEEIAWRYDRRLYTRCYRKNKRCVRPSHIVVFGSNFEDIP